MRTLECIIEDPNGNVIGALTNEGRVMLPDGQSFPRAELIARARDLASAFDVQIPAAVEPILPDPV
jgi:hypothetical protein